MLTRSQVQELRKDPLEEVHSLVRAGLQQNGYQDVPAAAVVWDLANSC